jgi:Carboxypeptidase regulatory-like domain
MTFVCVPLSYQHQRQVAWLFFLLLCRSARRPLLSLVLVAAAASPSFAQQFATLNLTVTDPSGSVIPQAKVSIQNIDTGIIRTALSDRLGLAQIPGLPAGRYTLTVDAGSFSPLPGTTHPDAGPDRLFADRSGDTRSYGTGRSS